MLEQNDWVKRIIEKFIERSSNGSYKVSNVQTFMIEFGFMVDSNFLRAWENLVKTKIIIELNDKNKKVFVLNSWEKATEIRNIFVKEPILERVVNTRPANKYFRNLQEQFIHTTEQVWPNQGTYYFCTKEDDISYWVVLVRSKPNKRPQPYKLGSIKDKQSTISKMWIVILEVWKRNKKEPIYKKMAEDKDQRTFGNNRQPATAGFTIFLKFGWIREVSRKGKQIFYDIVDEDVYDKLITNEIEICPRCGLPAHNHFCLNCNMRI